MDSLENLNQFAKKIAKNLQPTDFGQLATLENLKSLLSSYGCPEKLLDNLSQDNYEEISNIMIDVCL